MNGLKAGKTKNKEIEEHWVLDNNRKYVLYSSQGNINGNQVPQRFGNGHVMQLFNSPFVRIKDSELYLVIAYAAEPILAGRVLCCIFVCQGNLLWKKTNL